MTESEKKRKDGYRLIQKNREWHKKTGIPTLESVMELNREYWPLSGYKPISERFDPDWFRPAAIEQKRNGGKYTKAPYGSKAFRDYWDTQYERCQNGYKTHGYSIPGDLYFFLNFYVLPVPVTNEETGEVDRVLDHPMFWEVHYIFAHYVEWGRKLKKDGVCLKPRGVGWSEYVASMGMNLYTTKKGSVTSYLASNEDYLIKDGILSKAWREMSYLNENTQRGMKKLRQAQNGKFHRRASTLNSEGSEVGWMSEIIAKIIDKVDKVRGNRTNLLVFEEAGSFKNFLKALATSKPLVEIQGKKIGYRIAFGTGGDESSSGEAIEGLMTCYYKPNPFGMLGFKHNFVEGYEMVETGFFFPAYACYLEFMNHQGVTDYEKAYNYFMDTRKNLEDEGEIEMLRQYKAEYPFFAEEAFAKSGTNTFNTIKASNQMVRLKSDKDILKPKRGELQWIYKSGTSKIVGVRFIPCDNGKVLILEEPERDRFDSKYKNLYVGGIDSIDFGSDNSLIGKQGSRFCAVVKKRFLHAEKTGNMYVAMYVDRPSDEREAYDTAMKLAIYYNCKFNVERTKKEVISHFRHHGLLRFMAKQPSIVGTNLAPNALKTVNAYGTPIGSGDSKVIIHYLNKIKSYINDYCELIFFEEMLKEIINYAFERKKAFDVIAAMGMAEMLDEDMDAEGIIAKTVANPVNDMPLIGYYRDPVTGYKKYGAIPEDILKARKSVNQMYKELGLEKEDHSPLEWTDLSDESRGKLAFELN